MANILVVDDEMGIRELLSEILGDEGHVVTTAENAQQARELRQAGVPDLVLLDIWMPDTDGVTLLKEWQRDGLLTMPVIMMSGHATIDTAVEATRIGALNFLEKPIALQKLLKAVQQGLSHSREAVRPASYRPAPVAAVANGAGDSLHSPEHVAPVAAYAPAMGSEALHNMTVISTGHGGELANQDMLAPLRDEERIATPAEVKIPFGTIPLPHVEIRTPVTVDPEWDREGNAVTRDHDFK